VPAQVKRSVFSGLNCFVYEILLKEVTSLEEGVIADTRESERSNQVGGKAGGKRKAGDYILGGGGEPTVIGKIIAVIRSQYDEPGGLVQI